MDGILLVDKPAGWTSHDVVARVRAILSKEAGRKVKVGHTGTLDPAATGLLVLVVGSYTKKAEQFSKLDKVYEAELTLGATSSTGDIEGEIKVGDRVGGIGYREKPTKKAVEAALGSFEGQIEQTPHAYSAVKIGGQRAYKLARRGETPKLKPRKIQVYSIQLTDYSYPKVKITAKVSSGTYIRSLAEDIGQKLNTGAYLANLSRISVGSYTLGKAVILGNIADGGLSQHLAKQ